MGFKSNKESIRAIEADSGQSSDEARGCRILIENVTRRFGSSTALSEVTMSIAPSSITVIVGGSGAGKTTLLRMLISLDKPTSGRIVIDNEDTSSMSETQLNQLRKKLGMVFQYSALLDSMTVLDNVAFPLREHRRDLKEKEIVERVRDKLNILGLTGAEARLPSELSGGMRKRAALARALMLEPKALFYDEPTSGLDPLSARLVDRLIAETRDRFGVTSVVISHDMAGALSIADEICLLSQGKLVASGPPHEFSKGLHPLARAFIAASGIRTDTGPVTVGGFGEPE